MKAISREAKDQIKTRMNDLISNMTELIQSIPVIEDEEKPFVEGHPYMWSGVAPGAKFDENEQIITLSEHSRTGRWMSSAGFWVEESSLRYLTPPELAEWKKKQAKTKAPVFEEGDVVWWDGIDAGGNTCGALLGILGRHKMDAGYSTPHDWVIIHPAYHIDDAWSMVKNEHIRHLTEDEWINKVEDVKFKARVGQYGETLIISPEKSIILTDSWFTQFNSGLEPRAHFYKAIIKALNLKVMPFKQWERMRKEKGDE